MNRAAGALRLVRPTMAPIGYSANQFETSLSEKKTNALSLPELRSTIATAARNLSIEADQLSRRLADDVADSLTDGDVVVTASYSSSLVGGFRRAAQQGKRIRVLALASGGDEPSFGRSESPMPRVRPAWTPFSCRTMSCRRQCDRRTWRSSAPILYCRTVRS